MNKQTSPNVEKLHPGTGYSVGARWWTPNPTSAVVLPVFGAALTSTQTIGRSVRRGVTSQQPLGFCAPNREIEPTAISPYFETAPFTMGI